MQEKIFLTNTLSDSKEQFVAPKQPIKMYVCGITPYDFPHIGHGRCYVVFDLLYRVLKYAGYQVHYCRNFTDIDDKILTKAEKELGDRMKFREISQRYITAFGNDMAALNCLTPDFEPRVTTSMPEIIAFIDGLIKKGIAYVTDNGDVYYSIEKFPNYGKLSKRNLDDLVAGARIAVREEKRAPFDFALWKADSEGSFWKGPWGSWGRPGWHIDCSAMVEQNLHSPIDIHGGGMDLIFPHHENEIAQTEGLLDHPMSRFWVHVAFITVNEQKMSKSLGNFMTLNDIFKQIDPMVLRLYLMQHHFRAPLEFALEGLQATEKSYERLTKAFAGHTCPHCEDPKPGKQGDDPLIVKHLFQALCDDLNTSKMFGILFEALPHLKNNQAELCAVKRFIKQVLGLKLEPVAQKVVALTPEIERLLAEREDARARKDYKMADMYRDQLRQLGYEVQDKKAQ